MINCLFLFCFCFCFFLILLPVFIYLYNFLLVSVVDLRLGKKDGDDHLFIRIGDEWRGDLRIGLIIGHVSIMTPSSHLEIHLFISLFFTSFNGVSPDYITYVFSSTKDNHLY